MATAIGILLLAVPFVMVGGVVAILTYVLGTPPVRKTSVVLRANRRRSPSLHHAGGTCIDASAAFAAVVASSLRRAISSTIAVV